MALRDRLRALDTRVLGPVPASGTSADARRRGLLYAAVIALVTGLIVYFGVTGDGWFSFFTDDPWWWLVLTPCVLVGVVRTYRSRRS